MTGILNRRILKCIKEHLGRLLSSNRRDNASLARDWLFLPQNECSKVLSQLFLDD